MENIVLVVDCGTQSMRTMLIDSAGNILIKKQEKYGYLENENRDFMEFDVNDMFYLLVLMIRQIKNEAEDLFERIEAVTITTQRDTIVLVDRNGEVLRPAISWMDRRKATEYGKVPFPYAKAFQAVGMTDNVRNYMEDSRFNWIKENEPEIWKRTYKYLLLPQYLNYRFIGEYVESDAGTVGHIPFDYKARAYDSKIGIKRQIFQIELDKLANVKPTTSVLGYITKEMADLTGLKEDLPLIASGSDKACETVGVGCTEEGSASVSLGSQVTIQVTTPRYYELTKFVPPFDSIIPDMFNPEMILYRGFWLVTWFINEFGYKEMSFSRENEEDIYDIMDEKLEEIPAGSDGLILQPYWGQDILRPEAKGSILGFNDRHTRIHIYRAIIEGIGYTLKEGIEKIEKVSKVPVEKIALSGGGSNSDVICQILCDIIAKPCYAIQTHEASGLGAAMAAFVGLEKFSDFSEAKAAMVRETRHFIPNADNSVKYEQLYAVYRKIYKNVKKLYRELDEINL